MSLILLKAAGIALLALIPLAAAAWLFDRFAPARFVRERHDLALAVFCLFPIFFAVALAPADSPALPANEAVPIVASPAVLAELAEIDAVPVSDPTPAPTGFPWPPAYLLIAVWLGGSLFMGWRLVGDALALQGLRSRSRPVETPEIPALSRALPLRRSAEIMAPLYAGYWRPAILVPEDFTFGDEARPVLEHEIAHHLRGDAWTVLGLRVVTVMFWWAAPLYLLHPILSRSREMLCDLRAAEITGRPTQLAHALLDAAQRVAAQPTLALEARPDWSDLSARIRLLASDHATKKRETPMRLAFILPALAAAAFVFTPNVGAAPFEEREDRLEDEREGDLPLYLAADRGRLEEVRALINGGADPDEVSHGDGTALIAASRNGDRTMVQYLIAAGADVDAAAPGDGNPLIGAARAGHADIVSLLLAEGADPNGYVSGDETPLINVAQTGSVEMAQLLVQAGADPSLTVLAPTWEGEEYRSPVGEAERHGHEVLADWLRARGAEHRTPGR